MYLVYIIRSENKSYVGMTNDFFRRWCQHNKILKGGAKYTTKYDNWYPICIVDGFKNKSEAMQCEWRLKRARGWYNRLTNLSELIKSDKKWTKKSPNIKDQMLTLYVNDKYKHLFQTPVKELYWL
tara:strand:- start:308 stop:682 length:375 start_codon:yes stop_codon:yes gene_type:complete